MTDKIKIKGIEFEEGGFNTLVSYQNGSVYKVVTGYRPGGESYQLSYSKAVQIQHWLETYLKELWKLKIPVPETKFQILPFKKNYCVWIEQDNIGIDFASLLRYLPDKEIEDHLKAIKKNFLDPLGSLKNRCSRSYFYVGADLKTDNFCLTKEGKFFLVDLFPPHIWVKGRAIIEMFPISRSVYETGVWKIFTYTGMLINTLTQLGRVRVDAWHLYKDVFCFDIDARRIKIKNLQAGDVYLMRWMACEYAYQNGFNQKSLESFFKKTHFERLLTEKQIREIKKDLMFFKKGEAG